MRQRNDTQTVWRFAETDTEPAHDVAPGETADHPTLLDGWTALDDAPEPTADEQPKPTSRKRAAAADNEKDGGEPK